MATADGVGTTKGFNGLHETCAGGGPPALRASAASPGALG
jgi:hypothetical protein